MNAHISVAGIVQGVGFRPFVYGLAKRLDLRGWVRNTSAGVEILVEGDRVQVECFVRGLKTEAPPLARIDAIAIQSDLPDANLPTFNIQPSTIVQGAFQPIPPDVAVCADCERELFDPRDRRYLYPFINCTNCGPRFTIIKDIPYDRPATTMSDFEMCADCRAEYDDPSNRRFHAQPVACPECGPFVELRESQTPLAAHIPKVFNIDYRISAILKARKLLKDGYIVAVKGIGGFHLACDASNKRAVNELRRRKGRAEKPFAVMAADLETVQSICEINDFERDLLTGHEKPIVLLAQIKYVAAGEAKQPSGFRAGLLREDRPRNAIPGSARVCEEIAPGLDTLGVMLPYAPLHYLLLNQTDPILMREPAPSVLAMTSGNVSEEPIACDNAEALERLAPLADAFLLHNRDIHVRCDDSVVMVEGRRSKVESHTTLNVKPSTFYLRRSRGYAPYPVHLPFDTQPTLAVGGELKNAFCLTRERSAFLSHHIGDMENVEVYKSFERGVEHLNRLFRVQPELIAYDPHPGYFTTRYAQKLNAQTIPVQHHHAHIAACMADNNLDDRKTIGLSFDGTGYGLDRTIWGGEFLLASYADFERVAHLQPLPLPGGDSAIRHPWRIAVGYAHALGIDIEDLPFLKNVDALAVNIVRQQSERHLNAPLTSSMGRLFDAAASLIGIRSEVTYEAQAAIEMEALSKPFVSSAEAYPTAVRQDLSCPIPLQEILEAVVRDVRAKESPGLIGARFHKTIAQIAVDVCRQIRAKTSLNETVLSGGVWQNQILLNLVRDGLENENFTVYFHKQVPCNDGGLALGQAVVANTIVARR